MERLFDYQVEDDDKTALIANDDEVTELMCSWNFQLGNNQKLENFSVGNSKVFISVGTINFPTTYMLVEGCT